MIFSIGFQSKEMINMDNHERMIKTFEHEEPDRVLVHHRGILPNGTFYQNWMKKYAEDEELPDEDVLFLPHFGDLTLSTWVGQDTVFGGIPVVAKYQSVKLLDAIDNNMSHPILKKMRSVPKERWPNLKVSYNGSISENRSYNGMGYNWHHDGFFSDEETRKNFYERYGDPLDDKFRPTNHHFETYQKQLKTLAEMGYPKIMVGQTGSFWEALFEGMGLGAASRSMRKFPKHIHDVIDMYFKNMEYAWKMMLDAGDKYGPIIIGLADDLGQKGRGLVSVKNWVEFIKPKYKRLMDLAHKRGAYTWQHCCGFMEEYLPDLIDAGLDAIQSLEPAAGVDIQRIVDNHGDKMTFVGGFDSTNTMSFGTEADVIADVKKCLKAAMPNGGYFAGTSHRIINVPIPNVVAMRETIKKYGTYPCKL
jgi:Uroporphyrinogen decarboxylase (URO-D)